MARRRITLLGPAAVGALILTGCEAGSAPPASTPDRSAATTSPVGDDAAASAPIDHAAATTTRPGPAAGAADGDPEGGAQGQAAADRAKEFLLALVDADPAACGLILSFSDTTRPMREVESDLELCEIQLPETMAATVAAQGMTEEERAILEAMQITGADVREGDPATAVVDADNYSDLFADSMSGATMILVRLDGEWFVDLDRSFQDS